MTWVGWGWGVGDKFSHLVEDLIHILNVSNRQRAMSLHSLSPETWGHCERGLWGRWRGGAVPKPATQLLWEMLQLNRPCPFPCLSIFLLLAQLIPGLKSQHLIWWGVPPGEFYIKDRGSATEPVNTTPSYSCHPGARLFSLVPLANLDTNRSMHG